MRFLFPLVALCALSSAPLRASDIFDITLTGNPGSASGSGMFTTDGICSTCTPGIGGLLSLSINIGPDSGMNAFDIRDDILPVIPLYDRPVNTVAYRGLNSETNDILDMEANIWNLTTQAGSPLGSGTYSVTPGLVPEPSALTLLTTGVVLVALRWRHWRRHA
jgi:hypothetical protein